jgi:hypothetical protein
LGITIVELKNAKHIDLSGQGSDELKERVNGSIAEFLGEPPPATR